MADKVQGMRFTTFLYMLFILAIISGSVSFSVVTHIIHTPKIRHLAKDEGELATAALAADDRALAAAIAEDALPASVYREAVIAEAEYVKRAHTDDGKRFSSVIDVYLSAIASYGAVTSDFAVLKYAAHQAEDQKDAGNISYQQWMHSEATLRNAGYRSTFVLNTLQSCRDEAESYLYVSFHPPVDNCLFRLKRRDILHSDEVSIR